MKRSAFIKHLERNGCYILREGGNHTIYINPANQKQTAVGRHTELDNLLCKKICKQLDIPMMPQPPFFRKTQLPASAKSLT